MKKRSTRKRKPALISHHRHTGKRLPHEYTSWPIVLFLLLFMGVFMLMTTMKAKADDYTVNAVVPATLPTIPAVIVTPADGTHVTSKPVTLDGTCDANNVVKLYRNTVFAGSVFCASDGTFQMQSDLSDGDNTLESRIYSITDGQGPTSSPIHVFYNPPATGGGGTTGGGTTGGGTSGGGTSSGGSSGTSDSGSSDSGSTPTTTVTDVTSDAGTPTTVTTESGPGAFVIGSDDGVIKGYYTGDKVEITLDAEGGVAPYAFNINWGDGTNTVVSRKEAGKFTVSHVYKKAGDNNDSYDIKITASDASNYATFLQLAIIVHDKNNPVYGIPSTEPTAQVPGIQLPMIAKVMLPAYGVTSLMAVSFWLGGSHHLAFRAGKAGVKGIRFLHKH